MNMVSLR